MLLAHIETCSQLPLLQKQFANINPNLNMGTLFCSNLLENQDILEAELPTGFGFFPVVRHILKKAGVFEQSYYGRHLLGFPGLGETVKGPEKSFKGKSVYVFMQFF